MTRIIHWCFYRQPKFHLNVIQVKRAHVCQTVQINHMSSNLDSFTNDIIFSNLEKKKEFQSFLGLRTRPILAGLILNVS